MRIAITGGRHYRPTCAEMVAFFRWWAALGGTELLHGDYPDENGVDRFVAAHVYGDGWRVTRVPVDHAVDGAWPAAGPKRNVRMLKRDVEALIPFPGDSGTASCVASALRMGIPVYALAEAPL